MKLTVINLDTLGKREEVIAPALIKDQGGEKCVAYVINWQGSNRRGKGAAKTKTMAETSGSTRKTVQQKGSGGARHCSRRAVQFVGGRTCFGPMPRDFSFTMPKKIVKKALAYVLRQKLNNNEVTLIEGMNKLKISTKDLNKKLKENKIDNALVAYEENYDNFLKSLRNIPQFKALNAKALNVYDLLRYKVLLLDVKALEKLKEVLK
jgi:large subunit ribosomal protein L4